MCTHRSSNPNLQARKQSRKPFMATQKLNSRKPMEGIFTRSKSQIYFHRNRSGRARFDPARFRPSDPNFQNLYPILKKRKQDEEALSDLNDVSRNLRVRRVFSPSFAIEENGENSELGLKSHSGIDATEIIGMGLETDQPSVKLIRPNESISMNKMVVKPGMLRKVFKTSSSFNYRRLLPFLMGSYDTCVSEIENDDTGFGSKVHNMNNAKSNSLPDKNNSYAFKNEPMLAHQDDSQPSRSGGIEKLGIRSPLKQPEQNCGNLLSTQTEVNVGLHSVENTILDNNLNGIDDEMGDHLSMTPPDPDIFHKFDVNNSKACVDQSVQQIEKKFLGNPSNGRFKSNNACTWKKSYQNPSERNGSNLKTKMVLNPCSRKKVLKPPCSISYRRLLPYLMDVAKDTKDEPTPLNSQASTANNASEVLTANASVAMSSSTSDSTIKKPILVLSEEISEPIISFSSEVEWAPQIENILSDAVKQLEPDLVNSVEKSNHGEVNCVGVPSSPVANADSLPKIPETSELEASNCEGEDIQQVCCDNNKYLDERDVSNELQLDTSTFANLFKENTSDESSKPIEESNSPVLHTVGCAETLLKDCKLLANIQPDHLEGKNVNCAALVQSANSNKIPYEIRASNYLVSQNEGTLKGVLKRNARGCRGRCDCLNCASFRLHAERAFEFSKHQMQDTEEVALELINELSNIRKLLENSTSHEVKEACTKAQQAEQLAKERLSQMNDELHYHCRITNLHRPRVTFSISTTDLPTSPKNRTDIRIQRKRSPRVSK